MSDLRVLIELDRPDASLGPVRDALDLAAAAPAHGVRVMLTGRKRGALRALAERFGVEVRFGQSRPFSRLGLLPYAASVVAWIVRLLRSRPHVLHLNYISWGPSSACAARWLGIPVVARGGGDVHPANLSHRWIERYLVNCAEQGSGLLSSPLASRVVVAGSLLSAEVLDEEPELERPLPAPRPGRPRFLYLGRIEESKGLDLLLEALGRMRAAADLWLVGGDWSSGGFAARLVELRRRLGLEDRVHLENHRDDALALMRHFDALVLPSRRDTLPRTLLEAMFAGLPVVASAVGGIPGVVDDGVTGRLVPAGDAAALTRALEALAEDRDLRERMGRAARETALGRLHPERAVQRYVEVYREVAGR